jgi:hypothetical protein
VNTLVDTNVLLRRLEPEHSHHRLALDSIAVRWIRSAG